MADAYVRYMSDPEHQKIIAHLLAVLDIEPYTESSEEAIFEGKTFCITGSVNHYKNRNELKAVIEERGGKVTGSVTSKTHYLINNDTTSNSSKNRKAKELQIPIISEEDFIRMLEGGEAHV